MQKEAERAKSVKSGWKSLFRLPWRRSGKQEPEVCEDETGSHVSLGEMGSSVQLYTQLLQDLEESRDKN